MHQATFDVPFTEDRNRVTTLVRVVLFIPHHILAYVWQIAAQVASLIHWFVIVFTGKRNRSLWDFTNSYIDYASRAYSYLGLMHDAYPPFGTSQGNVPSRYSLQYDEPANRLTVGLRIIWAIPTIVIGALYGIALFVVTVISWFAIVFTGKHPKGMFDFMLKAHKYLVQMYTYVYLLTDKYPSMA